MNVAVFGAKGRVGRAVVDIAQSRGYEVWQIDKDCDVNPLNNVDVCVDFSLAEATKAVCDFCVKHRCPLVSGVTGRTDEQNVLVDELRKRVGVITKSNFSRGANMLEEICAFLAQRYKNWDCEIVETHRNGKKDSPSGTALSVAGAIAKNKGSFATVTIHSLRMGSCFGKHEVIFATNGERLTLTHEAESVEAFARGAIETAEELVNTKKRKTPKTEI